MCLCWLKTPLRFVVGKGGRPVAADDPDTPKKPSRASTWKYEPLPAIFDRWKRWSPEPPWSRGLAHLCVCVRPHPAAREFLTTHLVCRDLAQGFRIGPDFQHTFTTSLGAPGLHWSPMLRGGYRRRRRMQVWDQHKVPYTVAKAASPTAWGSLKTRSSSTLWHRRRLRRQVAAMNVPLAYFLSLARDCRQK